MISPIISFKKIPFESIGKVKIPSQYSLPVKNDCDVFVKVHADSKENAFVTEIEDFEKKNIATNKFKIDFLNGLIKNAGMDVWGNLDRGKGFGIVMHLNNVMALFENNLERIQLESLGQAVFFHSLCKFEPDLKDRDDIETTLVFISSKDTKKYPDLKESVQKADKMLDEIMITGGMYCRSDKNLKRANDIVKEYIELILQKKLDKQEKEEYGFNQGFRMVLTKERILENKDFFNKLFESKGIDYEIKSPE